MASNSQFGGHGEPELSALRAEALPPLYELVAEYRRMLEEIAEAAAAEKNNFERTLWKWAQRERAAARKERD